MSVISLSEHTAKLNATSIKWLISMTDDVSTPFNRVYASWI